jgi:hypothetical protein
LGWNILLSTLFSDTLSLQRIRNSHSGDGCYLPHARFLLDSFLHPEDGGDMFLRNVGCLSADYTAFYPRRKNSSLSV